jgi:sec-independent protein translocase protein TatA
MGGLSIWHWLILIAVVLLLFGGGKGKVSGLMGDFGKGIKSFKDAMAEGDKKPEDAPFNETSALPNAPAPDAPKTPLNQG